MRGRGRGETKTKLNQNETVCTPAQQTITIWGPQGACYLYIQKALCIIPSEPQAPRACSHSRAPRTIGLPSPDTKQARVLAHTPYRWSRHTLKQALGNTGTVLHSPTWPLTNASSRPRNTAQISRGAQQGPLQHSSASGHS